MKFGQNFHLRLVPEWEPFYVNYDLLKKLFKSGLSSTPHDFTELYTYLGDSTNAYCAFHEEKYAILHRREAEICKRYGLKPYTSALTGFRTVDFFEKVDLRDIFLELRTDFIRLQSFDRVNQDATQKIYTKLAPFQDGVSRSLKSDWIQLQRGWRIQCLEELQRLDILISHMDWFCSEEETGGSFYINNLQDPKSPSFIEPTKLYYAIRDDEPSALAELFEKNISDNAISGSNLNTLIRGTLELSITSHSTECLDYLLSEKLLDAGVTVDHNCLNHLITVTGLRKTPILPAESPSSSSYVERATSLFLRLLERAGPNKFDILQALDPFGRLPLHYAARYGLTDICHSILQSLRESGPGFSTLRKAILSVDSEGDSPLQCALTYNHKEVMRILLDGFEEDYQEGDEVKNRETRKMLSDLLIISLRYQHDEILRLLASSYVDIGHRSGRGQTALYVAAQIGREDYVKMLLGSRIGSDAIDISETVHGWTPLFVACTNGHLAVVKLLLQAGANQMHLDDKGWTAKEHAAFKGHLTIAGMLDFCKIEDYASGPANTPLEIPSGNGYRLETGQSLLVINLGPVRTGKTGPAVKLIYYPREDTVGVREGTELLIEISVPGSQGLVQNYPILDEKVYEPFVFPIDNHSEAMVVFKIFYATPDLGSKGKLVGSGTAILSNFSCGFGEKRESLIRDHTIPIIDSALSHSVGTVTFTYIIAEPYRHVDTPYPPVNNPLETDRVQLVGHRGFGQNNASHKHLQLGENTVESFISAAKLGASIVEFDVQLTKDLVPVIYHDFSLSETGTDIPIHDLSLKQFMYASHVQSPRGNPVSVLGDATAKSPQDEKYGKQRSRSLTRDQERGAREVRDRMKYTVDFTSKGFKPNTRGDFIQDSFTTLEELLIELPKSLCFNIEIKYPRLHEAIDAGVAPIGIEINTFVDATLDKIYRFGAGRPIILSSFTPEICILLSVKQKVYPVMFITNAGKVPITDQEMRGGSLQVAIRFAKQWNLAGLVLASDTFMLCPRLIKHVKNRGLKCASYGSLNDIPENAKIQVNAGIDILMADRVGLIAKALKDNPSA